MTPDYSSPFQHPLFVSLDVSQCLPSAPLRLQLTKFTTQLNSQAALAGGDARLHFATPRHRGRRRRDERRRVGGPGGTGGARRGAGVRGGRTVPFGGEAATGFRIFMNFHEIS